MKRNSLQDGRGDFLSLFSPPPVQSDASTTVPAGYVKVTWSLCAHSNEQKVIANGTAVINIDTTESLQSNGCVFDQDHLSPLQLSLIISHVRIMLMSLTLCVCTSPTLLLISHTF